MGVSGRTELEPELELEPAREERDLKCRLLSLPPEIRDMIYRQLLAPTGTLEIWPTHVRRQLSSKTCLHRGSSGPIRKQAAVKQPVGREALNRSIFINWEHGHIQLGFAILRTCKQIHDEALARFYEDNVFKYKTTKCIYNHLAVIGPRHRASIRNIQFLHHPRNSETRWVGFLPQCTALRNLDIFVDSNSGDYCERAQRRVLRVHGLVTRLKRVRGSKLLNVNFQEEAILAPHLTQDRKVERRPLPTLFDAEYLREISGEVQELMRWPRNRSLPCRNKPAGVRSSERLAKRRQMEE